MMLIRATEESLWNYRVHSRKPKLILMTIIKTRLTFRKPKRTEWSFLKVTTILNTQRYPFQSHRIIVV